MADPASASYKPYASHLEQLPYFVMKAELVAVLLNKVAEEAPR
jgi:hypothetical protein